MKHIAIFLLLVFLVAGCATQLSAVDKAQRTAVLLLMDNGSCSGTKIGPHAILSATHCFEDTHSLSVDGVPAVVTGTISDNHDHTILFVNQTFRYFVTISQIGHIPSRGDPVFILGNPGWLPNIYRAGHVGGPAAVNRIGVVTLYDLQDFPGDSGAGIFDDHGRLVGVISIFVALEERGARIQFAGSYDLAFTPAQLAQANAIDVQRASP